MELRVLELGVHRVDVLLLRDHLHLTRDARTQKALVPLIVTVVRQRVGMRLLVDLSLVSKLGLAAHDLLPSVRHWQVGSLLDNVVID